jgi:hypothetical protein
VLLQAHTLELALLVVEEALMEEIAQPLSIDIV